MKVNVVSYNIHSCVGSDGMYSVDRVAESIASSAGEGCMIDIVCLQEVEVNHEMQQTRVWSECHDENQPMVIGECLSMRNVSFLPAITSVASSSWREEHGTGDGEYGIAILTNYDILREKHIAFPRYKHKTLRNAMACLLQLPSSLGRLWVVNTHLGCHFVGDEQYVQSLQLATFLQSLEEEEEEEEESGDNPILGILVCGDFNSPFFFQASTVLLEKAKMVDTWEECGNGGYGCTFPSAGVPGFSSYVTFFPPPMLKLDYIFYKKSSSQEKLQCTATFVVDNPKYAVASDHLPLVAQFSIT